MPSLPIQRVPVKLDGGLASIAVATTGRAIEDEARPLVWIHGLGAGSTVTFAQISQHAAMLCHPSLLIDLPGSGASLAPDAWPGTIEDLAESVLAVVSCMARQPVVLFGHSMGGSVAIAAAHRRPDLIHHLIVAEPNLDPGVGTTSVAIARQAEADFIATGHARLMAATARLANQGNLAAAAWLPTLRQADPTLLHRAATSLLAPREPTFRDLLLNLPMPVSTIRGEHSPLPEPPLLPHPHLQGYVVRDAGHHMFNDNPDDFATVLADAIGAVPDEA